MYINYEYKRTNEIATVEMNPGEPPQFQKKDTFFYFPSQGLWENPRHFLLLAIRFPCQKKVYLCPDFFKNHKIIQLL